MLIYDCELEAIADEYVQGCQQSPPAKPPDGHGFNFKACPYNNGLEYDSPAEFAVDDWIATSTSIDATNIFDEHIKELSNVLNWRTIRLGCSIQSCGGGIVATVACVYESPWVKKSIDSFRKVDESQGDRALQAGEEMYKIGKPCDQDGDCTAYGPSECDTSMKLCRTATTTTAPFTTSYTSTSPLLSISTVSSSTASPTTTFNSQPNPGL
ncbi:unnamed protein product [Heligmosomoides polygyrus]|uniref:SCP domain-containing protein n=1 Tax=Heligmosomoides polygyrus TaxID=6339 RepID=A0A3P8AM19_HELPZ|nr:unnamed protein product [Heligmosomoides polygyrus]